MRVVLPWVLGLAGSAGAPGAAWCADGPPQGVPLRYSSPQAVLAQFGHEPTIAEVQRWASQHAGAAPHTIRRWLRQSARFATLPQLQVEVQHRNDWGQGFDYLNADGSDLIPAEEPFPVRSDADQGQVQTVKVRLVWDLDKLVMSSERIRIINEAQDVVKLREQVLTEATRIYFERRRLQVERLLAPRGEPMARVHEELRVQELTAGLDALTGGRFSEGLPATPTR